MTDLILGGLLLMFCLVILALCAYTRDIIGVFLASLGVVLAVYIFARGYAEIR